MSSSHPSKEGGTALESGDKAQCKAKTVSEMSEASKPAVLTDVLQDVSACSDLVSFGCHHSDDGYSSASGDSLSAKGSRNKRKYRSETPPLPGSFSGEDTISSTEGSGLEEDDCPVRSDVVDEEEQDAVASGSTARGKDDASSSSEESGASQPSTGSRPNSFPDDMRMRMNWKWLCQNIPNIPFLRPGASSNARAGEGESPGISEAPQQKQEGDGKVYKSLESLSEPGVKEAAEHIDPAVDAGAVPLTHAPVQHGVNKTEKAEIEQKPAHLDFFAGTEARLEEILMVKLDSVYNDAIAKIVGLGYDYNQAKEAVIKYGSCYGEKDALANVVNSAVNPLNREEAYSSLEELQKEGLTRMINAVQAVRGPQESRGEAMWRLLMCDLDLNRACETDSKFNSQKVPATEGPVAAAMDAPVSLAYTHGPPAAATNFTLPANFSASPQGAVPSLDCFAPKGLPPFPLSCGGRSGPGAEQEVQITAAQVGNGPTTGVQLSWSLRAGKDGVVKKQSTTFMPGAQNGKAQQGSSAGKEPVFSAVKGFPAVSVSEVSEDQRPNMMTTTVAFPASGSGISSKGGKQKNSSMSGKATVQAAKDEIAKSLPGFRNLEGSDSAPAVVKACMEAILGAGISLPSQDGSFAGSAASTMAGLQAAVEAVAAQAAGQGLDPVQLAAPVARQMAGQIASQVLGCSLGQTSWIGDLQAGNLQLQQQHVRQHDVLANGSAEHGAPGTPQVAVTSFHSQASCDARQSGRNLPGNSQQVASGSGQEDVRANFLSSERTAMSSHAASHSRPVHGDVATGVCALASSTGDAPLANDSAAPTGQSGSTHGDSRGIVLRNSNAAVPSHAHEAKHKGAVPSSGTESVQSSVIVAVSHAGSPPSSGPPGEGAEGGEGMESVAGVMAKFEQLNATHAAVLEQCVLLEKRVVELEAQSEDKRDQKQHQLEGRVQQLERQLEEGKQWAQERVMQAARKLLKDQAELKGLRAERDEAQRIKKERAVLEDSTMKKLADMEAALRKASGQVDRANAAVRRLETENAEFRAEMQAANLRANEVAGKMAESAKREGRAQKKAQAWERQKKKMEEELAEEKRKLQAAMKDASQARERQQQAEVNWRQEIKAKEEAVTKCEGEKRTREQAETAGKRREEALRKKAEADTRRYREDIQRLERDVAQLRLAAGASLWGPNGAGGHGAETAAEQGLVAAPAGMHTALSGLQALRDANSRLLRELAEVQEPNNVRRDRECVMCMSEEMSVVFLPCAHLVVCSSCNELHKRQGMGECPSCRTPIQQRIRIYGSS